MRTAYQRKALPALNKSIRHWKRFQAGELEPDEKMNALGCACCQVFVVGGNCLDCPIALRMGKEGCRSTPFYRARRGSPTAIQEEIDFLAETYKCVKEGKVKPSSILRVEGRSLR